MAPGRPAQALPPSRRIVVTGIGSARAAGGGWRRAGRGERRPRLGDRTDARPFATAGCRSDLGGEVGDLAPYLQGDEARRSPRVSQLAVVAAREALADAGSRPEAVPGLGLVLGSHWGDFRSSETFAKGFLARGPARGCRRWSSRAR